MNPFLAEAPVGLVRVEALTQSFDVPVEVVLVTDLIQSRVERMGGTARQVLGRNTYGGLRRPPPAVVCPLPSATSVVPRIDRVDSEFNGQGASTECLAPWF